MKQFQSLVALRGFPPWYLVFCSGGKDLQMPHLRGQSTSFHNTTNVIKALPGETEPQYC